MIGGQGSGDHCPSPGGPARYVPPHLRGGGSSNSGGSNNNFEGESEQRAPGGGGYGYGNRDYRGGDRGDYRNDNRG